MAKNLTQLTARTATADTDLIHVNSGGTDYKQTKARFCNDIVQYIDFANTSSLTGQCDTLGSSVKSPAYFAGKINSYGHQSACGTPENNSYHVLLSIYSGNYHELTITDVDTGAIWRKLKINGTWQSSWTMSPTRNEITSINNSLAQCLTKTPPIIQSGDDLDNYKANGFYLCTTGITNCPLSWCALLVIGGGQGSAYGAHQMVFAGGQSIKVRSLTGSPLAWTNWRTITFDT